MALQPIDLQTVLLRLSQIGKDQATQQNAATHNQATLGDELVRESREMDRTVRQARTLEDGTDSVNEDEQGNNPESKSGSKHANKRKEESDNVWRDPQLGQNVDISG